MSSFFGEEFAEKHGFVVEEDIYEEFLDGGNMFSDDKYSDEAFLQDNPFGEEIEQTEEPDLTMDTIDEINDEDL